MSIANLIPGQPVLSWILVVLGAMLVLYFIRHSVHQLLDNLTRLVITNLKLLSRALLNTARVVRHRNKEVLLDYGKQQAKRELERQFVRLSDMVAKDLGRYPEVQRDIQQNIAHMEDKLKETSDVPPPMPEWTEAVEAIAKLKDSTKNDAVVGKLLQSIYEAFHTQQKEVMTRYREDVSKRHGILKSAMQHWRDVLSKLGNVERNWESLNDYANKIDTQVERFEQLNKGTDHALQILKASTSTQFFISVVVMVIAGFGAFVNYNLIALPMSELMPATSQVAGYDVADIGAAVIIMLEITVGLFFMEAVGITRLFPVIHFMEDKKRMIWATVCMVFLLSLCFVEAGLAYMREIMVEDKAMLANFLVGGEEGAAAQATQETSAIPMIGQMILGFVLPLILMFVAIPFESFIHTGRHVLGTLTVQVCVFFSTILRSLALAFKHFSDAIKQVYDISCFLPIWIEHLIESRPRSVKKNNSPDVSDTIVSPDANTLLESDSDKPKSLKQEA
ncbi:hypothetical protein HF888_05045 [Bermanella marisrubri]|uniref:Uncharacterized protein n=1 Tax=Bermanella marisrubri TaxID=207949 RepID=Q1N1Y1_9GAMM|nr:hypothetical protein [Bermanella marisrubri]EAT12150.1 hypothetical protein RED65_03970 [Oceanobacter sp. RED65] [Bermanella marisrubri]QIZ83626.1 hypothetical protein HF888_05045 [Bermanella marisrubri]